MPRQILLVQMDLAEIEFDGKYRTLQTRHSKEGMKDVLRGIPELYKLRFEVNKPFRIGRLAYQYPIIIYISHWGGDHWACPKGTVIQERLGLYGASVQWKAGMENSVHIRRPAPFNASAALEAGLVPPMSPETLALVRFYIARQAKLTDRRKRRIDSPDFDDLMTALRQVSTAMPAASRSVSAPNLPTTPSSVAQSTATTKPQGDIRPRSASSNSPAPPTENRAGRRPRKINRASELRSSAGSRRRAINRQSASQSPPERHDPTTRTRFAQPTPKIKSFDEVPFVGHESSSSPSHRAPGVPNMVPLPPKPESSGGAPAPPLVTTRRGRNIKLTRKFE